MIKYLIQYIVVNGTVGFALYLAVAKDMTLIQWIIIPVIILMGVSSLIILFSQASYTRLLINLVTDRKNGIFDYLSKMPLVDAVYDIIVILFLWHYAYYALAIVWSVHMYSVQRLLLNLRKIRERVEA